MGNIKRKWHFTRIMAALLCMVLAMGATVSAAGAKAKTPKIDFVTIAAILLVVGAIAVLLIVLIVGGNKKKAAAEPGAVQAVPKKRRGAAPAPGMPMPVMPAMPEPDDDDNKTMMLGHMKYLLVLKDVNDPSKVFKYPIMKEVTIGRSAGKGAQLVINYDSSVSSVHCLITEVGGRFYVKDLNSVNGTLLNGARVTAPRELTSHSVLTIGRLEMLVEIFEC